MARCKVIVQESRISTTTRSTVARYQLLDLVVTGRSVAMRGATVHNDGYN
jgi:hypothetical protein